MTDIAMRFVLEMLGPISDRPLGAFASVDLREAPDSVCLSLCLYLCVPKEGELIFLRIIPGMICRTQRVAKGERSGDNAARDV